MNEIDGLGEVSKYVLNNRAHMAKARECVAENRTRDLEVRQAVALVIPKGDENFISEQLRACGSVRVELRTITVINFPEVV